MKYFVAVVILIFASVVPAADVTPPSRTIYKDSAYTSVKGTPLKLVLPDHFADAGDGKTFRHNSRNAAIEVSQLGAPYADVIKVFTAEEMSTRGMRLLSKDNVTVDERPALLLRVAEAAEKAAFQRWTLVLGDYQETFLVSGTFPTEAEGELSAPLRDAVLTARWGKRDKVDPFENFRFNVEPTPKLTYTEYKGLDTLVVFTTDGVFPLEHPGDPLLLAGYEMNEEKIIDERAFAKQALVKTPHCKEVVETESTAITLGGMQGYESLADGKDETSGTPLKIYQAMFFADGYHIFLLGIVDVPRSGEYLAEFKATARTFKMK